AHVLRIEILWNRTGQQSEIELARTQALRQLLVVYDDFDVHARITLAKRPEQRREQPAAARPRKSHAQRSALQSPQFVELGQQVFTLGEQGERAAIDDVACGRE